ncbi:MAG: RelA/SpoT family protein [bacterium]
MVFKDIEEKIKEKYNYENVEKAYLYAKKEHLGKKRLSGDDYITHPIEVANILMDMGVSEDVIIAALLHEVINNGESTYQDLKENFGEDIAKVIDSLSKINKLELLGTSESSKAYLRKILVGMAEDVRVLYIKLADRLHNMRTNYAVKEYKQKGKADETLNIMVPIAHRLGMNKIKSELENLCLQYLKPDVCEDITEKLNASIEELNEDIEIMKKELSEIFKNSGLTFEIKGRVKSVYSIYNKLSTGRTWDDIYDILALRIFVTTEHDCYTAVGLIHSKYEPVEKRFKDYVANPKENMYQSLHTSVIGDNNKVYEVQIRTYEMDSIAEKGIASHWSYKEKSSSKMQNLMEQKLEMFRNIIESSYSDSDNEFEENLRNDIFKKIIYVYTPKGDVVELPSGSTPIDFAYRIHSNVGDTTVGAIVNDTMVSFDYNLQDGDIVSIKTSQTSKPNKDWLNIVKTTQAKNKIKSYFSKELRLDYINRGKNILEKELRKRKITFDEFNKLENLNKILRDLKLSDMDELYLSIGSLRYTAGYIINLSNQDKTEIEDVLINKSKRKKERINYKSDIIVDGQNDILVNIAKCCMPVKGDDIVGHITKTNGVAIHKKNCKNVVDEKEKLVPVEWNYDNSSQFSKNLYIFTELPNLFLSSLIEVCSKKTVRLESFKINENVIEISVSIKDKESLENLINGINRINGVKNTTEDINDL